MVTIVVCSNSIFLQTPAPDLTPESSLGEVLARIKQLRPAPQGGNPVTFSSKTLHPKSFRDITVCDKKDDPIGHKYFFYVLHGEPKDFMSEAYFELREIAATIVTDSSLSCATAH